MEQLREVKLSCKDISKSFYTGNQEFRVLDGLNFDVYSNEFLVLFGPGQCGKTTLLYMLAGIEPATRGEIFHNGQFVTRPDASRAVVYQTIALFPWLTVKGNVEYGPKTRNVEKGKRERDARHFIDMVGLTGFENSYPTQLSGGMKQRVGIARAYCNDPDILLMDEPFGHLDAQTRYMMQETLSDIWQKDKRTVVFVTNNIEEALYLADRILLFSQCPSSIRAEYLVDLPRPRNLTDPRFLELREEIAQAMEKTYSEQ